MRITRRKFLQLTAMAGATTMLPIRWIGAGRAYAFAQSPILRKFVTTLPGLGPTGANNIGQYITLPSKTSTMFAGEMTDVYSLGVKRFREQMHPDLTNETHFFGYYDLATNDKKYLGGAIVATRGTPVMLQITNQLPSKHILPVDTTLMAGQNLTVGQLPINRNANHLHGGLTPWFSDGTPFQWFTPTGQTGQSFMNVPGTNPPDGTGTNFYPMNQSARMLWYHDHAVGITRLNAYAGIVSAFFITDEFESYLLNNGLIPDLVGVPLVIQDKSFVPSNIFQQDPSWQWGAEGDLWYPHVYEPNIYLNGTTNPKGRWDYGATVSPPVQSNYLETPLPSISCVPEAFFDTTLVNGAPYPVLNVSPTTCRFRILNGSQARFWHLNLLKESGSSGEADTTTPGPAMYQIGTEGGFLPGVVVHKNNTFMPILSVDSFGNRTANPDGPFNLLLAPAERADLLIDFSGIPAGTSFILYNDAPAPFPGGDVRNDYYTGNQDQTSIGGAPATAPNQGPNTQTVMRIVVGSGSSTMAITPGLLQTLNAALANNFGRGNPGVPPQQDAPLSPVGFTSQIKTLNEDFDDYGRLLQRGGTGQAFINNQGLTTYGQGYMDSITETVCDGETQVWDFYNTTGDTHPWHFHLVNVQLIGRAPYNSIGGGPAGNKFNPPDPNERGWKDTVRMNPGEVTRVIMKFVLPTIPCEMGNPVSPRTGGHEYVHHCHILEHEEHDMMRTLVVK